MLNSRYAPVVALGALGVLLVLVLGWFLAISPQIRATSELATQQQAIEANTVQLNAEAAKIDEYAALIEANPDVPLSIALNAPSSLDVPAFRNRLSQGLRDSRAELVSLEFGATAVVDGWVTSPQMLVSTQVASLFQTAPIVDPRIESVPVATASPAAGEESATTGATTSGGWSPAVTPVTEEGALTGRLLMVPVTVSIAGSPAEAHRFMTRMSDPTAQLFQVYTVDQQARQADGAPLLGVKDAADGDVVTTISGALYVLNPSGVPFDEGELADVDGRDGAFDEVGPAPAQPGA